MRSRTIAAALVVAFLCAAAPGPALAHDDPAKAIEKAVEFGAPQAVSVSWTDLVVAVPVRIKPVGVSGHVEKISFDGFELNGIPFELEPYTASFDLPEDAPATLPEPLLLRARFSEVAPGVLDEAIMPHDTLR